MSNLSDLLIIFVFEILSIFMLVYYGWPILVRFVHRQEKRYDLVLNRQLLMDIQPRHAVYASAGLIVVFATFTYMIGENWLWGLIGAALGAFMPHLIVRHIEIKRKNKLNEQLVDGIISLASGVRAGLTLVQSMELLIRNSRPPIRQEFEHMLREYNLGVDLHQCMLNASDRIGSSHYRLLFAAVEAHRKRGGDMAESLDRIADAIREIQRLEGKLQTLTAQGRNQAVMMASMPVVILIIMYFIVPEDTARLFTDPVGRLLLLIAAGMIGIGFLWIRKIMRVEI